MMAPITVGDWLAGTPLVILLVVYRSPILPIAVLLSAVFGLCLAVLVIRPLAENGTIELSGQSQGIMFILVVGGATDYALLLVSRFREELHEHESPWVALRRAWRGSVEPIVASAATVILGLLCLMLASLRNTAGLGPVGALGITGALLASLTFLPAVLLLNGGDACVLVRRLDDPAAVSAGACRYEVVFPGPEAAAVPATTAGSLIRCSPLALRLRPSV